MATTTTAAPSFAELYAKRQEMVSLHEAAAEGNVAKVTKLLDGGVPIDVVDTGDGCMALHRAAFRGRSDVVRLLLARGANVAAVDDEGCAPLHRAVERDHVHVAELLCPSAATAASTPRNKRGETALHLAAKHGSKGVLKCMLQGCWTMPGAASQPPGEAAAGCDPSVDIETVDAQGLTPLLSAAASEEGTGALRILLDGGANVAHVGKYGDMALHLAVCHLASLSILLDHCTTEIVNAQDDQSGGGGLSALHHAAHGGHTDALELLMKKGANINAVSADGSTPLRLAIDDAEVDAALWLLDHGADASIVAHDGKAPRDVAAARKSMRSLVERMDALTSQRPAAPTTGATTEVAGGGRPEGASSPTTTETTGDVRSAASDERAVAGASLALHEDQLVLGVKRPRRTT